MACLSFSFAQIEAFSTVAALGTVSQAAKQLGKDRATVSELIEFLEAALGYALFSRQGRTLALTPEGQRLKRQAALLMRQAQAFDAAARHVRHDISDEISLVYDPFVPRPFLCRLIETLAESNIRVSAWSAAREEAEAARCSWRSARRVTAVWAARWRGARWGWSNSIFTPPHRSSRTSSRYRYSNSPRSRNW